MKVIFVIGAAHTGTTWLCLVLGASQDCMPVGELYRFFPDYKKYKYRTNKSCAICKGKCKIWDKIGTGNSIINIYKKAFHYMDVSTLVDSSKKIWFIYECMQEFDVKIIYLKRDIYDSIYHYYSRGKDVKASTKKWCLQCEIMPNWLKGEKYITINYEEAFQPKVLKKICEYVEIEYNENMLKYWKKPIHPILGATSAMLPINLYHDLISIKSIPEQQKEFYEKWNGQTKPLCLGKLIPENIKRIIDKNAN